MSFKLLPALKVHCTRRCRHKAREWDDIVKIGRTHLMDATPIRLGPGGFRLGKRQVELGIARLRSSQACHACMELAIGGTAVGTGINSPAGFGAGRLG